MPQYMISLVGVDADTAVAPDELAQVVKDVDVLVDEAVAAGIWVFGGGLGGNETASVVDAGSGTPIVTDGPYVETKETMGGFSVIDVPDLATAQQWAGRFSAACRCPQEVRPILGPPEVA